jgi:ribosomal protein S18 acetylase RimI-like enzyme
MTANYTLHINHDISPGEFGQLAALAHWGDPQDFTQDCLESHFAAVDFVAHVRDSDNRLLGYAAAMSNGLGSVYLDSLLTHPEFERDIIGSILLKAVLDQFPNHPVFAMPFVDEQDVFRSQGFKVYRREMIALANRNDVPIDLPHSIKL